MERVLATPAAVALVRRMKADHGPLLFHLSGGCCEGSAPMCLRQRDFSVGPGDVLLGSIEGCPVYVGQAIFPNWASAEVTVDVVPGGGDSFSLEAADGVRFLLRSRLLTDAGKEGKEAPPP